MIKKLVSTTLFLSLLLHPMSFLSGEKIVEGGLKEETLSDDKKKNESENETFISEVNTLYIEMHLESVVSFDAFEKAITGYNKLHSKNKSIFTIIDYSKASTEERLCVIDMSKKKLLYKSHVSHGRNSGDNYARYFSNKYGSYKSSLGFYRTGNTYLGNNGYSLVLNGLEYGINHNAKARSIVMHGADYCDPSLARSGSRLGRSLGCPALPHDLTKPIINKIKGGTLIFVYAKDKTYLQKSNII